MVKFSNKNLEDWNELANKELNKNINALEYKKIKRFIFLMIKKIVFIYKEANLIVIFYG